MRLKEIMESDIASNAKTLRILKQLRAENPQAQNDIEALIYDYRKNQRADRSDIARLDRENDAEDAEIDDLQRQLDDLRRRRSDEAITTALSFEDDGDAQVEGKDTWQKYKNPRAGGMSKKSVKSYRRANPGSKIQTAVTTKPSKLKKGSKAAKRRLSFCRRMRGMKKKRTSAKTARDPNSAINKSLRRWNCESIQEMRELVMIAEQRIQALRESLRDDEHHRVRVTLDDGSEKTVRIKTDEGFRERIRRHFERQGHHVVDIDVDWSVRMDEKQDACYHKVKSRYKVWPSAYASGALVQCRKKGADNWGKGSKR